MDSVVSLSVFGFVVGVTPEQGMFYVRKSFNYASSLLVVFLVTTMVDWMEGQGMVLQ